MTGSWTILWLSGRIRKFATSLDVRMSGAADELTRAPERVSLLQPGQHREALIKSRNLRQMDAPSYAVSTANTVRLRLCSRDKCLGYLDAYGGHRTQPVPA